MSLGAFRGEQSPFRGRWLHAAFRSSSKGHAAAPQSGNSGLGFFLPPSNKNEIALDRKCGRGSLSALMKLAKLLSSIYLYEGFRANDCIALQQRIDKLVRRGMKMKPGTASYKAVWFAPHDL